MKNLSKVQKTIFVLGVLATVAGLYGKFNAWEHNDYFPIFYVGLSFLWIPFLKSGRTCSLSYKKEA
ncbi:hypothetical protein [Flagellimonas flava]|uniref:Uncharacterized protein n=1 Tax=Flagellimonas flava TaxID=570519 RepID=A0A1M5PU02_9FLAO|nr:hypothetical protein [Allomuricauda flava]SHH05325.1 hypothetical protein SAMN04488116_3363 [Allomuricauda flava]